MKNKLMGMALALALTVGLCPGMAFAAADDLAAARPASTLATQASVADLAKKATKAMNALPAASKVKLSDVKKVEAAFNAVSAVMEAPDFENLTKSKSVAQGFVQAYDGKFKPAQVALDKLIKSETSKTKKAKVKGVKVNAGSKKATVSWTKLGAGYKYEVYYSLKKSSGFKKAASTNSAKLVVNKLAKGKKYYFKVRGFRVLPMTSLDSSLTDTVYTKYSSVVVSKAIK